MKQVSHSFADYTREDLRAMAPETLVILPVGATEQHGPHLPVGTDFYIIEYLSREVARATNDDFPVLVAPALPFGCSEHHLPFGGTLSLRTDVYYRVISDLLRSLTTDGFRRAFVLNGHGGNHELIQLAARDIALEHPIHVGAASYWTLAWDDLVAADADKHGRLPGHAGQFESSVMMSLRGGLVSGERPRRESTEGDATGHSRPYRYESPGFWQSIDGYTDSPANGSSERGSDYLKVIVAAIARSLTEFYRLTETDASDRVSQR